MLGRVGYAGIVIGRLDEHGIPHNRSEVLILISAERKNCTNYERHSHSLETGAQFDSVRAFQPAAIVARGVVRQVCTMQFGCILRN
jgi:hypothetical protein